MYENKKATRASAKADKAEKDESKWSLATGEDATTSAESLPLPQSQDPKPSPPLLPLSIPQRIGDQQPPADSKRRAVNLLSFLLNCRRFCWHWCLRNLTLVRDHSRSQKQHPSHWVTDADTPTSTPTIPRIPFKVHLWRCISNLPSFCYSYKTAGCHHKKLKHTQNNPQDVKLRSSYLKIYFLNLRKLSQNNNLTFIIFKYK